MFIVVNFRVDFSDEARLCMKAKGNALATELLLDYSNKYAALETLRPIK